MTGMDEEDAYTDAALAQFAAYRWLSDTHVCEWAGIGCDAVGQLRKIDLSTYLCWNDDAMMGTYNVFNQLTNDLCLN